MAANAIEMRLARLEGSYEQISARLGAIESRLGQMDTRIDQRISRLEEKVDRQFHWVVGLILIATLVPIALRFVPMP